MSKNRRRKYFLSKSSQPKLLLGVIILILILAIIASGFFYVLANRELSSEYYKAHSTLRYVLQNLVPWLLLVNLVAFFITLFFAIFYTHRIAGPTYRIREDLKKIAQGELTTQIRIRKKDQLKELESEINKLTQELRRNIEEVKEDFLKLESNLEDLERATKTRDLPDSQLHQFLEKIKFRRQEIDRRLSLFKTK
ncbi:MAG: hypothetical protein ACE5K2_07340 [Candidatus Zixiibacteriota bacterium]